MLIIGEKINASIQSVAEAINRKDAEFFQNLTKSQAEAGADFIDVNAGAGQTDRQKAISDIKWIIDIVQATTDKPLAIDSDDVEIIKAALPGYKGKELILNSVTAETTKLEALVPLAAERKSYLVALAMGKGGIPKKVDERLSACDVIMNYVSRLGMKPEQIMFDPLVLPIAVDSSQGIVTLKTLEAIKSRYPGVKTVMGLSNISFGLPERKLINRSFLLMAAYAGLDAVILDPLDTRIMTVAKVADMLDGRDAFCRKYITSHRKGTIVS